MQLTGVSVSYYVEDLHPNCVSALSLVIVTNIMNTFSLGHGLKFLLWKKGILYLLYVLFYSIIRPKKSFLFSVKKIYFDFADRLQWNYYNGEFRLMLYNLY